MIVKESISFKKGLNPKDVLGVGDISNNPEIIVEKLKWVINEINTGKIPNTSIGYNNMDSNIKKDDDGLGEAQLIEIQIRLDLDYSEKIYFGYWFDEDMDSNGWYIFYQQELIKSGIQNFSVAYKELLREIERINTP